MWFQFPPSIDQIAINQQNFIPEFSNKIAGETQRYFRAPDHFAGQILDLGLGFIRVDQPKGAPDDLVPEDPKVAESVDLLAGKVSDLEMQNDALRSGIAELKAERDDLKVQVGNLEPQLKNAEADLKEAQNQIKELEADLKATSEQAMKNLASSAGTSEGVVLGGGITSATGKK